MRIDIPCMQCVQAGDAVKGLAAIQQEAELNDEGFYEAICPKGHRLLAITQNPKFEILFDLGGMALLDGYTRESVSSFAASLERFYEFYLRTVTLSKGIPAEALQAAWKVIANQSERQFGAFQFAYILANGRSAPQIENTFVEFRNKVIHKGYIPKFDEVTDYGSAVGIQIHQIVKELISSDQNTFRQELLLRFNQYKDKMIASGVSVSTMAIPTMLGLHIKEVMDKPDFSFVDRLNELRSYRTYVYTDFRKEREKSYRYELFEKLFGSHF